MESTISIQMPEQEALRGDLIPLPERARGLVVCDKASHGMALEFLKELTRLQRRVEDTFKEPKAKAHEAHTAICAAEKKLLAPIQEAKQTVTRIVGGYEAEECRKAAEEAARLAEQARIEADALAQAQAEAAEAAGDVDLASQIIEEAVTAPAPIVHVETQTAKVEGIASRRTYRAQVTDVLALIRHVAQHPEFSNLLQPNMVALNQMARAQRDMMRIPGVRAIEEIGVSVRA